MFVGDSLGRNQWESLICLVSASAPGAQTQMNRGDPISTFKFLVSLIFKITNIFQSKYKCILIRRKKKEKENRRRGF